MNKFMNRPMTRQSGMTMISMVIVVVFLLFQVVYSDECDTGVLDGLKLKKDYERIA